MRASADKQNPQTASVVFGEGDVFYFGERRAPVERRGLLGPESFIVFNRLAVQAFILTLVDKVFAVGIFVCFYGVNIGAGGVLAAHVITFH